MIIMNKLAVFAIRESHESIIKFLDCPVVEPIADTDCESLYLILLYDVECTEIMEDLYESAFNPRYEPKKAVMISPNNSYNFVLPTRDGIIERDWLYIAATSFSLVRYFRGFLPLWKRV